MISYKEAEYGRLVPVLHKVHFNKSADRREVRIWCENNCRAMFYTGPSWAGRFVEFEDDEDAMWFSLRYS